MNLEKLEIKRIQSATLIEVLIAMVIIGFTFTIGITIYLNVIHRASGYRQLRAEMFMRNYVADTRRDKTLFNDSVTKHAMTVEKKVKELENGLYQIEFVVIQENRSLVKKKYYMTNEE